MVERHRLSQSVTLTHTMWRAIWWRILLRMYIYICIYLSTDEFRTKDKKYLRDFVNIFRKFYGHSSECTGGMIFGKLHAWRKRLQILCEVVVAYWLCRRISKTKNAKRYILLDSVLHMRLHLDSVSLANVKSCLLTLRILDIYIPLFVGIVEMMIVRLQQ